MAQNILNRSIEILKDHEKRIRPLEALAERNTVPDLSNYVSKEDFKALEGLYRDVLEKYNKLNELYTLNHLETLKFRQSIVEKDQIVATIVEDIGNNDVSENTGVGEEIVEVENEEDSETESESD